MTGDALRRHLRHHGATYMKANHAANQRAHATQVGPDWWAQVGQRGRQALRLHIVSCERSDDPTKLTHNVTGFVGVPRYPRNEEERVFAAQTLMHHTPAPRAAPYAITAWDVVPSSHGVMVVQHAPIATITDKEILPGTLKVTKPAPVTPEITDPPATLRKQWVTEYVRNRYLQYESREELTTRLGDAACNAMALTAGGAVDLSSDETWIRLTEDVGVEAHLRGHPLHKLSNMHPDVRMKTRFGDKDVCKRAIGPLKGVKLPPWWVVKYGEKEHMRKLYKNGDLLVSSASSFDKQEYNQAVRDKELKFSFKGAYFDRESRVFTRNSDPNCPQYKFATMYDAVRMLDLNGPGELNRCYANIDLTSLSDFRLYCVSSVLAPELFSDFDKYDACVMFDWRRFVPRLLRAMRYHMPQTIPCVGMVWYQDPLGAYGTSTFDFASRDFPTHMAKHFGYAYQKEVRIAWVPKPHSDRLCSLEVTVGPMEGYACLIEL